MDSAPKILHPSTLTGENIDFSTHELREKVLENGRNSGKTDFQNCHDDPK
jgi:hypothetical protein